MQTIACGGLRELDQSRFGIEVQAARTDGRRTRAARSTPVGTRRAVPVIWTIALLGSSAVPSTPANPTTPSRPTRATSADAMRRLPSWRRAKPPPSRGSMRRATAFPARTAPRGPAIERARAPVGRDLQPGEKTVLRGIGRSQRLDRGWPREPLLRPRRR
jgi:hypothetical protein